MKNKKDPQKQQIPTDRRTLRIIVFAVDIVFFFAPKIPCSVGAEVGEIVGISTGVTIFETTIVPICTLILFANVYREVGIVQLQYVILPE